MPFQTLNQLVSTAEQEVRDVLAAKDTLAAAKGELETAQSVVAEKQAGVDTARDAVTTETSEAITSLRAIIDAVQDQINELQPAG